MEGLDEKESIGVEDRLSKNRLTEVMRGENESRSMTEEYRYGAD